MSWYLATFQNLGNIRIYDGRYETLSYSMRRIPLFLSIFVSALLLRPYIVYKKIKT